MKILSTPLNDVKIVELKAHGDSRGFFVERFNAQLFSEAGLPTHFLQDNHSRSAPGILRGLHLQHTPAQAKLVGCIRGRLWDVVVDCRMNSSTFGKHFGLELNEDNFKLLWIPTGFAHGFCVLGDQPAELLYKVTELYRPAGETGFMWNDSEIGITWPIENPVTSERDQKLGSFRDFLLRLP